MDNKVTQLLRNCISSSQTLTGNLVDLYSSDFFIKIQNCRKKMREKLGAKSKSIGWTVILVDIIIISSRLEPSPRPFFGFFEMQNTSRTVGLDRFGFGHIDTLDTFLPREGGEKLSCQRHSFKKVEQAKSRFRVLEWTLESTGECFSNEGINGEVCLKGVGSGFELGSKT